MNTRFTPEEFRTIHNKKFFRIKTSSTKKIEHLLASVRDELKNTIEENKLIFPEGVDSSMGKIFRGENYLGLPYLVLDYPKYFSKDSVFAFRTMFWWGNFFSCTLHLQGKALEKYRQIIIENRERIKKKSVYVCVNDSPWQYHYKKENYLLIDKFPAKDLEELFRKKDFIKLSRKVSLDDYKSLAAFSKESFLQLLPFPVTII